VRKLFLQIIFYSLILGFWQGVVMLEVWPEYLFPGPAQVFQSFWDGFSDKSFFIGIGISLKRILLGYALSILGGLILGFLFARFDALEQTLGSLVLGLHTLPSICWMPLGILWFGLSDNAILMVVIMGSLFSLTIAIDDSIKNISPVYVRAARTMGTHGLRLYWDIVLPAAFPNILSGLKQGWSFAWRALMAGELLFVSLGLGHLLQMGRELNDVSRIFAVMMVIVGLGLLVDFGIFGMLQKRVRSRWGLHETK
jgi:NitT/TauT family transport system permease protein